MIEAPLRCANLVFPYMTENFGMIESSPPRILNPNGRRFAPPRTFFIAACGAYTCACNEAAVQLDDKGALPQGHQTERGAGGVRAGEGDYRGEEPTTQFMSEAPLTANLVFPYLNFALSSSTRILNPYRRRFDPPRTLITERPWSQEGVHRRWEGT